MRAGLWGSVVAAFAVAGCVAAPPAQARDLFTVYGELFTYARPAALVAVALPSALGPVETMAVEGGVDARGPYSVYYQRYTGRANGPKRVSADLLVRRLPRRSLGAEARAIRKLYREQPITVRGRRGLLLRARRRAAVALMWSEGRRLYLVGTFTPGTVSRADLLAVASGLDHVVGVLQGQATTGAEPAATGANALVTERAVILSLFWGGPCRETGAPFPPPNGESAATVTLPLSAGAFTLAPAPFPRPGPERSEGEPAAWTLSLAGSASPAGGDLTLQASGAGSKISCETGSVPIHLHVNPRP